MRTKNSRLIAPATLLLCVCPVMIAQEVVTVTVIGPSGSEHTVDVERDTEALFLHKTLPEIERIEGLEQLTRVKRLSIGFSDLQLTDFSFLDSLADRLTTLDFTYADLPPGLAFLARLPGLIAFASFETFSATDLDVVDLAVNTRLEYFHIHGVQLPLNPELINVPESLEYAAFNGSRFDSFCLSRWAPLIQNDVTIVLSTSELRAINDRPSNIVGSEIMTDIYDKYGF